MSYAQHVKHSRNHRKHRHTQPIIMSTGGGFWPSIAFLEEDYLPYVNECKQRGETPMSCQDYYNLQVKR